MAKVAIVTDSTASLPESFLNDLPIKVAPLVVLWDNEIYHDGIDIQPDAFYSRLEHSKSLPTTSQVSPVTLRHIFTELIDQGYEVLGIFISGKLSGTMQSALAAKEMLPDAPIEVMDSGTASMGMGFQVLAAARKAKEGAALAECRQAAEHVAANNQILFLVDTLEFLHRGGRIGGAARFIGTALGLKPLLEVREGRVEAVERVRTQRKAFERVLELMATHLNGKNNIRIATLNAKSPELAAELMKRATEQFQPIETVATEVSPVLGTHVGPGTIGLVAAWD